MGIKMSQARDQKGHIWDADTYQKGRGAEPLLCMHCETQVAHNPPYPKEMYDKPVFVPGYFRLMPKRAHAPSCQHGVDEEINKIAKVSEDLIESLEHDKYRLRLVMIQEALGAETSKPKQGDGDRAKAGRTYSSRPGHLPAYINSANRVLKLRAMCESNAEMEQHLELVFEGNVTVSWDQFYFDQDRHMHAYHAVSQNTVQHPIALQGQIKSIRYAVQNKPSSNVINLVMNKLRSDPNDSTNGVGLEVSIWSNQPDWFKDFAVDDEVVILGIWKHSIAAPRSAPMQGGRFQTLTNRRLMLNLALKTQISRVEPLKRSTN
ncbi:MULTISPECIES: hypothetical protein [Pseudomonas putida group]|uniref:hypothetical protein n=1 Tax=Pseudomonas putida group TaxID=136845 RepID=UPI0018A9C2EA|nr:hypothetical protein [Pseudomonas fulva]MBF8776268.1 hypothetical protein [Pseudomonas fulva]